MLMEIILVRHAQPLWTRQDTALVDPPLTDLGRDQAQAAAAHLATFDGVTELLVSPSTRARETAVPVAESLEMDPVVCDWLEEIRLPAAWDGTPTQEVGRVLREARTRPRADWWEGMPGGESFRAFHQRVCTGLDAALVERGVTRAPEDPGHLWHVEQPEQRIVIVAHAGTNSVVLGYLLGLEPEPWEWERFASDHASLTLLSTRPIASGCIFSLQRFSDVGHLSPSMVTA